MTETTEMITETDNVSRETSEPIGATSIIQVIERAAMNPDVDMEKMERLLVMQERILDRQGEVEFSNAMARVQAALPTVTRNAYNQQTSSKYAKHESLAEAIKPVYTKEGFSITFSEGEAPKEGFIRIIGILRHRAGYKEKHHVDMPLDIAGIKGSVNKTPTHATGSTFSYGRRYLTCLIFDVATGDDTDGQAGIKLITEEQANAIHAKIVDNGVNMDAFMRWLNKSVKADSIPNIRANAYETVMRQIDASIKARAKK